MKYCFAAGSTEKKAKCDLLTFAKHAFVFQRQLIENMMKVNNLP